MKIEQTVKKEKKPYQKPELKAIDLAAEEVLGVGCKTLSTTGTGLPAANCILASCAGQGS